LKKTERDNRRTSISIVLVKGPSRKNEEKMREREKKRRVPEKKSSGLNSYDVLIRQPRGSNCEEAAEACHKKRRNHPQKGSTHSGIFKKSFLPAQIGIPKDSKKRDGKHIRVPLPPRPHATDDSFLEGGS